jgi:hypothetical protein
MTAPPAPAGRPHDIPAASMATWKNAGHTPRTHKRMSKHLKTAPELERLVLLEMRRHAVCAGVVAVTVRESSATEGTNWEVAHVNALGGNLPTPCADICSAAVDRLRQEFELLPEFEWDMDF